MTTITISIGQPGEGANYNPAKPLPYPIHVDTVDFSCVNVPATTGNPSLIGFQETIEADPMGLLIAEEWVKNPDQAVGMYPVFSEPGGMFNLTVPVTAVAP